MLAWIALGLIGYDNVYPAEVINFAYGYSYYCFFEDADEN